MKFAVNVPSHDLAEEHHLEGMEQIIPIHVDATSKQEAVNKALQITGGTEWHSVTQLDEEAPPPASKIRRETGFPEFADIGHIALPKLLPIDIAGGQKVGRQTGCNIEPQDLIKEQNTDAQMWALAFASQFDLPEHMDAAIHSWFASAIETAKDHVRNARPVRESLTRMQEQAEKHLLEFANLKEGGLASLRGSITRAYNAGYEDHIADVEHAPYGPDKRTSEIPGLKDAVEQAEADADYERDQEARRDEYAKGIEPTECGMAEQSAEGRRRQLERRQDQADLIDLILSYRNPASDEARMRQIRVVME